MENRDINGFHTPTLRKIAGEASKILSKNPKMGDKKAVIEAMRNIRDSGNWVSTQSYAKQATKRKSEKTVSAGRKIYTKPVNVRPQITIGGKIYKLLAQAKNKAEYFDKRCEFEGYNIRMGKPSRRGDTYKLYGRKAA
jgi:hypothetical protein